MSDELREGASAQEAADYLNKDFPGSASVPGNPNADVPGAHDSVSGEPLAADVDESTATHQDGSPVLGTDRVPPPNEPGPYDPTVGDKHDEFSSWLGAFHAAVASGMELSKAATRADSSVDIVKRKRAEFFA